MAIYHLSAKPVSRSAGRSATASAAYRAGEKILDTRTGDIHDYMRRGGVESADIVLPAGAPEWAADRAALWNAAELAEKRKDACVAREFEVALPAELRPEQRRRLALEFAQSMATEEGCAVDVAIHAPGKKGDNRNHHAHILRTTRKVGPDGFGAKLDTEQAGRKRKDDLEQVRERWAEMTNAALARAGHSIRVDHRTLDAQGIDRDAGIHLGPAATAIERRGGVSDKTANREAANREAAQVLAQRETVERAAAAQAAAAEQACAVAAAQEAAAEEAARQAQREAAEINAKLTAAKEEKENDRIRAAALAALAKSGRATERALAFAVADHGGIVENLDAASGDLGRAGEGAEQRVARSHLESSAPAVGEQLEQARHLLQQLVRYLPRVVETIAAAAKVVTQQARAAAAQAKADRQQAREAAAAQAQAARAAAPQAQQAAREVAPVVSPFDKTGLSRADDLELVRRAKELFSEPQPDGYARYMLQRDISSAMSAAVREIRDTEPRHASADAERTIKEQQNAAARQAGQPEPWKAEQTACAWDTIAFKLERERREHLETKRPSGMFSGAAGKEYDAKTDSLTSQIENITRAAATLKAELQANLAAHTQQAAQRDSQRQTDAQERHEGIMLLYESVGDASRDIEAASERQRDFDRGDDFGR